MAIFFGQRRPSAEVLLRDARGGRPASFSLGNHAPTEFKPLPTTREQRGREIARLGGIRQLGARYVVPSQSANANVPTYLVDVVAETCTCPDYETRRVRCKHQEAVLFWLAWEGTVNAETGEVTLATKPRRKTYRQDWASYERAQTVERERVPQLLHSLCETVEEPTREPGLPGRKPIPRREAIYAISTKVYSLCSGRRAEPDIKAAVERGHLSRVWDPNTLFRVMEDQLPTADADRALRQIDAEMEAIVDAVYRAMGVDPAAIRKPTVADPAWQQRVLAAKAKAQQSPLWSYWEASASPKYDDWRATREGFATRPMTTEDYDRWRGRVGQLRSEVKAKGVKLETPEPVSVTQPQAAPGATSKLLTWGAIGALAIGGVALLAGLASTTKAARAPYERYRYGYLVAR